MQPAAQDAHFPANAPAGATLSSMVSIIPPVTRPTPPSPPYGPVPDSPSERSERAADSPPRPDPPESPAREADTWLPFQRLDAYRVAKELVRRIHAAKITDSELRDQATRAAKRAFLGLCEGLPNEGQALRRKYFVEANASLHETLGAVDLAATIEALREEDALAIQLLGVRLKRMLRALLH